VTIKKRIVLLLLLSFIILPQCGKSSERATPASQRPSKWAEPISLPGVKNFFKVSDTLYRGAQPQKQGFQELEKMGIKSIVNLRNSNDDQELMTGTKLEYFHIPMIAFFPKKNKFKRFLEIVSNPANQPVFVHCKHGADRTGAAVALYRIKIQNWKIPDAINEMVNGGYNFHKIHNHLKNFIRKF